MSKDFSLEQKTIAYSEIDKYAINTYKSAFSIKEECLGDIVEFNKNLNPNSLLDFELLTGGFPCQPFSMMGSQNGFNDKRGGLFFEIIKLIKVKRPPFILLENVRNLISHNKGETIKKIVFELEKCGYHVYFDIFNSADFGLAQKRNRVYIFATTKFLGKDFAFKSKDVINVFERELKNKCSLLIQNNTHEVLEKKVDQKYYLSEKIKPTILANGSKNYIVNSTINPLIARPLTATMVKMHRACQDNYFSDGYIHSTNPYEYVNKKFSKSELAKQKIRKLTPREAFKLQGFDDKYFEKIENCGTSQTQLYKQAGNAVSVNTVYCILYYLFFNQKIGG